MTDQHETKNAMGNLGPGATGIQAEKVVFVQGTVTEPDPEPLDPWVKAVASSTVWRHVPEGRDVKPFRTAAVEFISALVPLRDEDEARLAEDPWLDPGMPLRFHTRITELLGAPGQSEDLDLYPAEAALLVCTPFLFRVYELRRAVSHADLDPSVLTAAESPSPDRVSFEAFAAEFLGLTERVLRRGQDEAAVSWWLYHRWLLKAQNSTGVDDLWALAPRLFHRLWKPERVRRFLHGLRLGPDVCNPEHLEGLREDEYFPVEGQQHLRERRLALLLALGFGMSLETHSLPDTVVEHLGIPHSVDLAELRETVDCAHWGDSQHLLVLNAECHHEAVIEGMREHVHRVDELLHGIHRTLRGPIANLPSRLSSDRVGPVEEAFESWARFRIDERRARELLTGEQLYKDRDLAIRELYQNALDACRYRRARTEYLNRRGPLASFGFEGRIEFAQGVDEDGRAYVDCVDNGVGMGEEELRGVFSHAGSRFAEQSGFLMEQERWAQEDPPILLYPNSRFGIGVLSYFMLADEIRVTTCRMRADGNLGPELEAAIHGPGHLFRVVRTGQERRQPGTAVRLYLKDDVGAGWSCVEALGTVLVIAEFRTTAADDQGTYTWPAGEPRLNRILRRSEPPWELDASWREEDLASPATSGEWIHCGDLPGGASVVWIRNEGGLLVDGLLVDYPRENAVFTVEDHDFDGTPDGPVGLYGAVVNLAGPYAAVRLSADRRVVLSDPSAQVLTLMEGATGGLLSAGGWPLDASGVADPRRLRGRIPDERWLDSLTRRSPVIGDLVVSAVRRRTPPRPGSGMAGVSEAGYTYLDFLLSRDTPGYGQVEYPSPEAGGRPTDLARRLFDRFYLWRLLAVGDPACVDELYRLCPPLPRRDELRAALPTDQILTLGSSGISALALPARLSLAGDLGFAPEEVVGRWRELGLADECIRFPVGDLFGSRGRLVLGLVEAGSIWLAGEADFLSLNAVAANTGTDTGRAVEFLREHGATVPAGLEGLATGPRARAVKELVSDLTPNLLQVGEWKPPRLLNASRLFGHTPVETVELLRNLGLGAQTERLVRQEIRALGSRGEHSPAGAASRAEDLLGLVSRDCLTYEDVLSSEPGAEVSSVMERVHRLELCGVEIGLRPPPDGDNTARDLWTSAGLSSWTGTSLGGAVRYADILWLAQFHDLDVEQVLEAFDQLGVPVPDVSLSAGLRLEALRLLGEPGHFGTLSHSYDSDLSPHHLLVGARRTGASLTQVAEWFRELGFRVPDLETTLRDAAPHIPRR